jgi:CRISPR-associated protein (TIGR03986 family)
MNTRYLISFQIELLSPMHLGTGEERPLTREEMPPDTPAEQARPFAALLAKGHDDRPVIPGASLKGLLRAKAAAVGMPAQLLTALFGSERQTDAETSQPGCIEFRTAFLVKACPPQIETRTGINRITRTVSDGQLFNQETLSPGEQFDVTLVLRSKGSAEIQALCHLLNRCTPDHPIQIGAHKRAGWGTAAVKGLAVKVFGSEEASAWWRDPAAESDWSRHAKKMELPTIKEVWTAPSTHISLPLTLAFDGPFAVRDSRYHKPRGDTTLPDTRPRMRTINGATHPLLPATSLQGALRSQGERIHKTLSHSGAALPRAQVLAGQAPLDLIQITFGCEGWQGLLGCCADFLGEPGTLQIEQDMLAVCRFTGGGQDSAKFRAAWFESPRISGKLQLNSTRLHLLPPKTQQAVLGLLALIWRDLQEGDISFGMGRSKGWGLCQAPGLLDAWNGCVEKLSTSVEQTLSALRAHATSALPAQPALAEALQPLPPAHQSTDEAVTARPATTGHAQPQSQAHKDRFHNPYAFIPLASPNSTGWASWADVRLDPRHPHRHDHYQGLSGRLKVRLETVTPLFVGASQTEGQHNQPNAAEHYRRSHQGSLQAAIPATSLRGMLSNLHESLTNSNLRVLNNGLLSVRKPMNEALSALGRITRRGEQWMLEPLCPPTLLFDKENHCYGLPSEYFKLFGDTKATLRVLLNASHPAIDCNAYHYVNAHSVDWALYDENGTDVKVIEGQAEKLRHPSIKDRHDPRFGQPDQKFLIGRKTEGNELILDQAAFDLLSKEKQAAYVRGFIRTIRLRGRDIPNTVRHATFVPYGELRDTMSDEERRLQPIPTDVIHTLHTLADQARDRAGKAGVRNADDTTLLPYTPLGRPGNTDRMARADRATRLQEGDLVYFDVDNSGAISELSFSAIWRKQVDWVSHFVEEDLLPLGISLHPRGALSPTEWLFGAVSQRAARANPDSREEAEIKAWAGKVRISDAFPTNPAVRRLPAVTLKELSSPKPPSPALYFQPKRSGGNGYVSKTALAESPENHQPNGRKHYLHAMRATTTPSPTFPGQQTTLPPVQTLDTNGYPNANGTPPWASRHDGRADPGNKRRIRIEPVAEGEAFVFTIDFDNLSLQELQDLCASIQPTATYVHRLGMGKPLGLGSVKLSIDTIDLIDRCRRYLEDTPIAARYQLTKTAGDAATPGDPLVDLTQRLARSAFNRAAPAVRQALTLLGDPRNTHLPVHYPQMAGAPMESEHFKWFMHNDRRHNPSYQSLKPFTQHGTGLPYLTRPPTGNNRRE